METYHPHLAANNTTITKTEEVDLVTIAFSCRKENSELVSTEVLISQKRREIPHLKLPGNGLKGEEPKS